MTINTIPKIIACFGVICPEGIGREGSFIRSMSTSKKSFRTIAAALKAQPPIAMRIKDGQCLKVLIPWSTIIPTIAHIVIKKQLKGRIMRIQGFIQFTLPQLQEH